MSCDKSCDWSSDVCSSDLNTVAKGGEQWIRTIERRRPAQRTPQARESAPFSSV